MALMRGSAVHFAAAAALALCAIGLDSRTPAQADARGYRQSYEHGARGEWNSWQTHDARSLPSGRLMNAPSPRQTEGRGYGDDRGSGRHGEWNEPHASRAPAPGRVIRTLPSRHEVVVHHGYRFHVYRGVWYRPYGARFIAVAPPIGAVVHALPFYYSRIWFYGVAFPYYYADNAYYVRSSQGYVVTEPPARDVVVEEPASGADSGDGVMEEPAAASADQANADPLYAYPRLGQSATQQDKDRSECSAWAIGRTGYDASDASGASEDAINNYQRALSACLEGRGYTVR